MPEGCKVAGKNGGGIEFKFLEDIEFNEMENTFVLF